MKRLTDTQKTAIRDFRAAGLGYKAIAEKLSLSRETVRSFCTRNSVPAKHSVDKDTPTVERNNSVEIKQGNTVFIITTDYSKTATETLKVKLEKLILDAVSKQSNSYQFVQEFA